MSNKIPTAEEFLKNSNNIDYSKLNWPDTRLDIKPFVEADLIQFAQLHVEAALKAASEKGLVCLEDLNKEGKPINSTEAKEINIIGKYIPSKVYVKKISILNAYPKENII